MKKMQLSSIVLLAGNSKRMGRPKQHVELAGMTFLQHVAGKLLLCREHLQTMIFVGQAGDNASQSLVKGIDGVWVENPSPEDGPLSSIRLALGNIDADSAVLLWPVDHPMIAVSTLKKLIGSWQLQPEMIAVPSDGQRRGHPGIYPAWCRQLFFEVDPAKGARQIMQMHPQRILHMVTDDPWITRNLNTPEILAEAAAWLNRPEATVPQSTE